MTGRRPRTLREALRVIGQLLQLTTELRAQVVARDAEVAALEAKVAVLEEQLRQTSQNSSRPPSTDPPAVERLPKRAPSGRRPGAQPGHDAQYRPLFPVEQVDVVVPVRPAQCQRCGTPVGGTDPTPRRHQVTETPPVRPVVTEYQLHTLACGRCGHRTTAPWPAGVPRGVFGPRLTATVAVCTGVYHLSKRTTAGLLADLFGVDLAVGTVSACEQMASAAVAAPVAAALAYMQQQAVVHVDETGWREGRQRAWLWVAVTTLATVFLVHARRGTVAARALLGEYGGRLVSDRWSAYNAWPLARRQLCWAHYPESRFMWRADDAGRDDPHS